MSKNKYAAQRKYDKTPNGIAYRQAYLKSEAYKASKQKWRLRARFGLTVEAYKALEEVQQGLCAICRKPEIGRQLSVDHCHTTGRVRGLLCSKCNMAIGLLGDSPDLVQVASNYLR